MTVRDPAPFSGFLGVEVTRCSPERGEAQLTVRQELGNAFGVLHGGAVMALGDTLGGMTAIAGLPADGRTTTIESKTNFFAALATRITRADGKLAAIVTQTQLLFRQEQKEEQK